MSFYLQSKLETIIYYLTDDPRLKVKPLFLRGAEITGGSGVLTPYNFAVIQNLT